MSDDAPAFYNACAWSTIITEVPNQLIGKYVDRNWPNYFQIIF
jgi:hypothetical protein